MRKQQDLTGSSDYSDVMVGDVLEFGGRTTEWVVVSHPCNSSTQLMVKLIKGDYPGHTRAIFQSETPVWKIW